MITESKAYKIANGALAAIFFSVFLYSAIFSYEKENHPIPSFHEHITGETSLSSGMSRSFSAIVRLEFDIAHQFNPYGLLVFFFFLEQFLLRLFFIILLQKKPHLYIKVLIADGILLFFSFAIHFKPFILS